MLIYAAYKLEILTFNGSQLMYVIYLLVTEHVTITRQFYGKIFHSQNLYIL